MSSGYIVKETQTDKGPRWIVVAHDGWIANQYYHPTKASADRHKMYVDAYNYTGDGDSVQSKSEN